MENSGETHINKQCRQVWRRVMVGLLLAIVIIVGIGLWRFIDATKVVDDYIASVDRQYREISDGENIDQVNVQLPSVWLGQLLSPKYRRAVELDQNYQQLIDRLRNYTLTMRAHNELVDKFNDGMQGNEILNSDVLELAIQLRDVVQKRYPERTSEIAALTELCQTIASNTNFADISGDVNKVLHSNDKWLSEEREAIEAMRVEFQESINSLNQR